MNKVLYFLLVCTLLFNSCKDDDDGFNIVPLRERVDEVSNSAAIIETYLNTHFYNYEEFENPPADFDFKIEFDTIAGDNADKIPLRQQVDLISGVKDRIDDAVTYDLYYLNVNQGGGAERPNFPDFATITYAGISIAEESETDENDIDGDGDTTESIMTYPTNFFDSSVVPVVFDMTGIVDGLQDVLTQFNTAETIVQNADGTIDYANFGHGAVFIPSGLGYYTNPPAGSGIGLYEQLIFTFQLLDAREGDQDNDGVPSIYEDRNGDGLEENDDTDNDGDPDFFDNDDDNDGRPTREEISDANGDIITDPSLYPDTDGDGIPNYLDADS